MKRDELFWLMLKITVSIQIHVVTSPTQPNFESYKNYLKDMYKIEADVEKNLVILHLEGFMSDDELGKGAEKLMSEVDKLRDGFMVINDIANMKPASQKGTEHIKKAQMYVVQKGVSRIIRVTNDPISKMQLNRTAKTAGYIAEEAKSMDEALAMVNELEKVS